MSEIENVSSPFIHLADADELEWAGAQEAKGVKAKAGEDVENSHAPLLGISASTKSIARAKHTSATAKGMRAQITTLSRRVLG
jgi:hypothetical protein